MISGSIWLLSRSMIFALSNFLLNIISAYSGLQLFENTTLILLRTVMIPFLILAYILLDTEHDYKKETECDHEEVWW